MSPAGASASAWLPLLPPPAPRRCRRCSHPRFPEDDGVAVEMLVLDHGIALHLERIVFALGQLRGNFDSASGDGLLIGAPGGNRPMTGTLTVCRLSPSAAWSQGSPRSRLARSRGRAAECLKDRFLVASRFPWHGHGGAGGAQTRAPRSAAISRRIRTSNSRSSASFISSQGDGRAPSFDEMKEALDLKSKSGIHRLITALRSGDLSAACPTAPVPWRS